MTLLRAHQSRETAYAPSCFPATIESMLTTTGFAELAAACDLLGIRLAEWILPDSENFLPAQAHLTTAGQALFSAATGSGTSGSDPLETARVALRATSNLSWSTEFSGHIELLLAAIDATSGDFTPESI